MSQDELFRRLAEGPKDNLVRDLFNRRKDAYERLAEEPKEEELKDES